MVLRTINTDELNQAIAELFVYFARDSSKVPIAAILCLLKLAVFHYPSAIVPHR